MLGAKAVVMAAHAAGRDAAVAAQCDGPPAAMVLQDGPDSEVALPPKTLRDIQNGGISNAAVAKAIEKDCGVKAADARKVLKSLAKIGMKEITRIGRFKLDKLARLKVCTREALGEKNYIGHGKEIHLKARPRRQVVTAFAAHALQRSVKNKSLRRSCAVVWDDRGVRDVIGPVMV